MLFLFFTYFFNNRRDIYADRTDADTSAATAAEGLTEFVIVIFKLVHNAVAIPFGLQVTRIVP